MIIVPNVIEDSGKGGLKSFSLPDKLFEQNIIVLSHEINDDLSFSIINQLLYLDAKEDCKEIDMYITSGGGSVLSGLGIIDVMEHIKTPVNTICISLAASMGNQILAAGTGTRKAMKNSRIMIHSIAGGQSGKIQDTRIQHKESELLQEKLMRQMAGFTKGKTSYEEILVLTDRDKWLSAEEAIKIGLIDEIV